MKKRYYIEHEPTCGSITVDIDHDFKTSQGQSVEEVMSASLLFFIDGQDRIDEEESVVEAFLKFLCAACMVDLTGSLYSVKTLSEEFKQKEGYPPIDGSFGIKLIEFDKPDFDNAYEYQITEKEVK